MIEVSVVISARNEFPNIAHTVHAIINDLETFLRRDQFEIIIVDNGSTDRRSWAFLAERGLYYNGNLKVLHDPIMGNVTARNKGALIAKGKWLFFSDAHMSYRIGSFKAMVDTLETYGGIVHPSVQWMGGYDPSEPSYQYSIKLGEKIWGTWNRMKVSDRPFYIPVCGHCCLGVSRQQFLQFHGYNRFFRCYGGGEVYLDMKWWVMGSTVMMVPDAIGYHLSAGRGYSYKQDDLIHNMMLLANTLNAPAMEERVYLRYLNKDGVDVSKLDRMRMDAQIEAFSDQVFIAGNTVYSFYDCITVRPWDVKNLELHGKAQSGILIYDETWTRDLSGEARAIFDQSPYQAELRDRIQREWRHLVYNGGGSA
jgi:glycosyltransferase involved in cell wall biosynthesis